MIIMIILTPLTELCNGVVVVQDQKTCLRAGQGEKYVLLSDSLVQLVVLEVIGN